MPKLKYDLHIHTALSACALEDMTPNNIVNMSLLNGLDVIAITDHNTARNVKAVMDVAKNTKLLVIPGMEIETKEEIHIVCLFSNIQQVSELQQIVYNRLPNIKNKYEIFGEQILYSANDDNLGREDRLLTVATNLPVEEAVKYVVSIGGVAIPAHIDRPSYSLISNLGIIPGNLKINTLEISRYVELSKYQDSYNKYRLIQNSDAHELGFIGICDEEIDTEYKTVESVIKCLRGC